MLTSLALRGTNRFSWLNLDHQPSKYLSEGTADKHKENKFSLPLHHAPSFRVFPKQKIMNYDFAQILTEHKKQVSDFET